MKKGIYLLLFIAFSLSGYTQKVWTYDECVKYAFENNIQIKQSDVNLEISKVSLNQAKANFLPKLSAGTYNAYYYGQKIDPYTNQFATNKVRSDNYSLQGSLQIFSGFQNLHSLQQANIEYAASKCDEDKLKNDISMNIALAYLQIIYNKELLSNAQSHAETTKELVKNAEIMVNAGKVSKGNLLDIKSQYANEEVQIVNAQNQLEIAIMNLQLLLELNTTDKFDVVTPKIEVSENLLKDNTQDIINSAISSFPEIKSAELKVRSAFTYYQLSKSSLYPNISLGGSIGTGYSGADMDIIPLANGGYDYQLKSYNKQMRNNLNQSIGISISIPIFNSFLTYNNILKAKLYNTTAEYNLQNTKKQLQKSVQLAYMDAVAALKKYSAMLQSVEALKESFYYAEQKFNIGAISSTDFNISKNNLAKAEYDLLQSKFDYFFKVKVLDFYQGKQLTF